MDGSSTMVPKFSPFTTTAGTAASIASSTTMRRAIMMQQQPDQHNDDAAPVQESSSPSSKSSSLLHWKTRDAAENLLRQRYEMLPSVTPSSDLLISTSTTTTSTSTTSMDGGIHSMTPPPPPPPPAVLSTQFDTVTCLHRIRRDKAAVARLAFSAAATTVLQALQKQQAAVHEEEYPTTTTITDDLLSSSLPPVWREWKELDEMRSKTLERSHNNKEYAKQRKSSTTTTTSSGGSTSTGTTNKGAAAVAATTATATAAATKGGGVIVEPQQQQQPPPVATAPTSTTVSTNAPTTTAPVAAASATATAAPVATKKTVDAPESSATTTTTSSSSSSSSSTLTRKKQFTRNTPASSAAALDARFVNARAILCAAGNLVFDTLTPSTLQENNNAKGLDVLDVPFSKSGTTTNLNMGAVVVEAQTLAQRTLSVVENAVQRSTMRYQYRKDNARYELFNKNKKNASNVVMIENPYIWKDKVDGDDDDTSTSATTKEETDDDNDSATAAAVRRYQPNEQAITQAWKTLCLPRLLSVLNTGAGHAVYHDVHWSTRHGRIAHLLRALSQSDDNNKSNFGPHLIVTVEPELAAFAQEFHNVNEHLTLMSSNPNKLLQVLTYQGSKKQRRKLRQYFPQANGLPESPFHVMVTSYSNFLEDFLHFCQIPFEVVILDDGVAWMAAAQVDQNSALGSIWENGIWSANDQQIGLAGTTATSSFHDDEWDFSKDEFPEAVVKEAWVGLTARHRMVTSSKLTVELRQGPELVPVTGLLSFVAPHFADVVREEWDRSRISSDSKSMDHFRNLVARATVVHSGDATQTDMHQLAVLALNGKHESSDRSDPRIPNLIFDDAFVSDGKINFSRRSALVWLGRLDKSWLRYELGKAKLQHILDAMKVSNRHGHFCEEITTASSTTSSGATGQVAGTMAYRLAIRCGRHFGSEQGLRQHISALHAPSGTWLCRTCGVDCITSQARTHHERSCGQPTSGSAGGEQNSTVGATPTVGQGTSGRSGVGKKKSNRSAAAQQVSALDEKDPDGSIRVPGYRGVWVNKAGKHFVKVHGKRLMEEEGKDKMLLFDNIDDAAKKYDEEMQKKKRKGQKLELNFKADGSRVVYEDKTTSSTSGLGGSAASVVPALSVINIKDLPPDVKPLLRDPRQTSRTGGNSKRHVYAYRGVCRQSRKGHDRWQSQISFMGCNHYLGTFDSEWDAAAIYAWAHLILYGEEATKQAQKEGEEAAAAYEQEKRDIAAGKIPEPTPKPKKKKPAKKEGKDGAGKTGDSSSGKPETTKKRRAATKNISTSEKKAKTNTKACKLEKEAIGSTVAKGVTKAPILAARDAFDGVTDSELTELAARRMMAAKEEAYCVSDGQTMSLVDQTLRPCIPTSPSLHLAPIGGAMLVGLCPSWFGFDLQEFVASQGSQLDAMTAIQMLAVEYDEDGVNERFRSVLQGPVAVIGRASEATKLAYKSLGLGTVPLGGTVGAVDCHVGGVPGSCGERAACIRFAPTERSDFRLTCFSDEDVVTLNGQRITPSTGPIPLYDADICSVGARVFAFVTPEASGE